MNSRYQDFNDVLKGVSSALGVPLALSREDPTSNFDYSVRVASIDEGKGVRLFVAHDFLQWRFSLQLEDYSRHLSELLRQRLEEREEQFQSILSTLSQKATELEVLPVVAEVDSRPHPHQPNLWIRAVIEYARHESALEVAFRSLVTILSLPLSLLEESVVWEDEEADSRQEGAVVVKESRSYERSRFNRAVCLSQYGFQCRGCGQNSEEKYGPLSTEVIDVHHIVPVSQMGGPKKLDPLRDLVPLCPNCHRVVHSENPPLSISELRKKTGYEIEDAYSEVEG